jgi:hypothetical protein
MEQDQEGQNNEQMDPSEFVDLGQAQLELGDLGQAQQEFEDIGTVQQIDQALEDLSI